VPGDGQILRPNPFGEPFNNAQWISLGLIAMVVIAAIISQRSVSSKTLPGRTKS